MLTSEDHDRLNDAIFQLRESDELRDFPRRAIEAARSLIPSDACGYAEVDTVRLHAATYSDNDAWLSPHLVETWAQHTLGPEILPYWKIFSPGQVIQFSDFGVDTLRATQIYQEFYREVDVLHQMLLPFVARDGVVLSLGFSRSGSRRDFTETERTLLQKLARHLVSAHAAAEALERAKQGHARLSPDMCRIETGLIVLTPNGNVISVSDNARRWVCEYFGNFPRYSAQLPEALRDWVRSQLSRRSAEVPVRQPQTIHRGSRELRVSVIDSVGARGPTLVLEHQELHLREVSRRLSTTLRETEVLRWVVLGKSNKEIAEILSTPDKELSAKTVQKHLQRSFQKLGVSSRTQATALIRERLAED